MVLHHLCGSQILACDAEASDTEGLNCFALHRSTSNACILHELSPALGACQLQPVDIGHIFVRRNSVVLIAGQVEDGAVVLGEDGFGVWVLMLGVQVGGRGSAFCRLVVGGFFDGLSG